MKLKECDICRSKLKFTANAVVSPWIRSLGADRERFSKYMFCENCGSGFFDYRYSNHEMSRIYNDYRGQTYLNARLKWEPWYNRSFNEEHDSDEFIRMRKESLYEFLNHLLPATPQTVVDVGGDRGQYIPNFGQKESYVIESSSKKLAEGIKRLTSLSETTRYNLILYSHVLEHVANPREEIKGLLQHCDYLYIEIPYGVPIISKRRKSKLRYILKLVSSFSPFLWGNFAKPATGRSAQRGVLVQSEHINFFSQQSLQFLAETLVVEAQIEVNSIKTPDKAEALVIQCLFTPNRVTNKS